MHSTAQKEQFSVAYVHAVASTSGLDLAKFAVDDDSVDVTLKSNGLVGAVRSPRLELQLKCTQNLEAADDGNWKLKIKRKNYDDLRPTNLQVPKLLVVMRVPEKTEHWLLHSADELVMRHCAFWRCLYGAPPLPEGQASVVVTVPRQNVFSVEGLTGLIDRIGKGVKQL